MTLQLDMLSCVFKNYLKKVLFLVVALVVLMPLDTNAFPVFCSDMASAPDRVLTGCQFNVVPPTLQDAPPHAVTVAGGASYPIEAMLSMTPKNRQLFQVGRGAIADDQDEEKKNGSSAGATEKQTAMTVAADRNPSDATSEVLLRDEHWYYMNIDQEGTYLFFGDMLKEDESTTGMDEDDFIPDGIGIGKKWRF